MPARIEQRHDTGRSGWIASSCGSANDSELKTVKSPDACPKVASTAQQQLCPTTSSTLAATLSALCSLLSLGLATMTTTMSETFDAQMSDAGDIDISMYSTMATTDSWLSVEASMGDDTFSSGAATFEYTHDGIEIEMGDDDEAITEYEMADGDGYDEELQDVEVYDISQAASPLMVEDHGDQHHEDTDPMHIPSDDPLPVAEPPPLSVEPAVAASSTYDLGERSQLSSPTTVPIVVIHDSDAALQDRSGETTAIAAVSETHVVDGPPAPAVDDYPVSQPSWMIPPALPAVPALLSSEAPELATVESVPDPHHESASSYENYEAHEAGGTTDAAGLQESVAGFEDIDVAATNESGDPHEISEGVYIDPPPPVLLSLPPSAEFGECSLFNLPTSSVPQSPSGSSKPASDEGLHLLLHDRPTLYYEPLSVVFAALREEQCIQNMPGFAEAELVLDAFDLQLCISEVRSLLTMDKNPCLLSHRTMCTPTK